MQAVVHLRFLNLNTPGGWENFMRDLASAMSQGTPPSSEEIGRIASRYDFQAIR